MTAVGGAWTGRGRGGGAREVSGGMEAGPARGSHWQCPRLLLWTWSTKTPATAGRSEGVGLSAPRCPSPFWGQNREEEETFNALT